MQGFALCWIQDLVNTVPHTVIVGTEEEVMTFLGARDERYTCAVDGRTITLPDETLERLGFKKSSNEEENVFALIEV